MEPVPGELAEEIVVVPAVLLDAVGEPWEQLRKTIGRRMDELAVGEVLELLAHGGLGHLLAAWCREAGHDLRRAASDGSAATFTIRRGGPLPSPSDCVRKEAE